MKKNILIRKLLRRLVLLPDKYTFTFNSIDYTKYYKFKHCCTPNRTHFYEQCSMVFDRYDNDKHDIFEPKDLLNNFTKQELVKLTFVLL